MSSKNEKSYKLTNNLISPMNKIGKFMRFTSDDEVLSDFIDYLSFYTTWQFAPLTRLLNSDNAPSLYLGRLSIDCLENKIGLFRAWVSTSFMGYSVKICQLREMKIGTQIVLKVDLYGKGLKLLRDDKDLRNSFNVFMRDWLMLGEELTITRIDYTVDCSKMNFRKKNTLRCRVSGVFSKDGNVKTKYFGVKGHDSAMFIRYYDKKEEISVRGTAMLYPEYQFIDHVQRYELQVNSKGLDDYERCIKFNDLYNLINMGFQIGIRKRGKEVKKDESSYKLIVNEINKLRNEKDIESLQKVRIYLYGVFRKGGLDCPVLCEISEVESRSVNN